MKIISLVPSLTETLIDFGLTERELIGRTKFCIHPRNIVTGIPILGGTKNIRVEKILELQPDLVIASKEENVKEQIEALQEYVNVMVTDIATISDAIDTMKLIAEKIAKKNTALPLISAIEEMYHAPRESLGKTVSYLIWTAPNMSIGHDTFIHAMMTHFGFENSMRNHTRYPYISDEILSHSDFIFLSSEPYPFSEKHLALFQTKFPKSQVKLVDGEAFSWYGTRMAKTYDYISTLLAD